MIPPKFSVTQIVGFLKGKSAIRIFRDYQQVNRNFTGRHFWARGYCVSTVGLCEQMMREYIRTQEQEEKRQAQMKLAGLESPFQGLSSYHSLCGWLLINLNSV